MTEVYKFRSIEQLLGRRTEELKRQVIYFASPEQLNDPMEGFRDIVWTGDKIVWTNLFKHYVFCLHMTYFQVTLFGDQMELEAKHIPITGRWDEPPTPQMADVFDDIWNSMCGELDLLALIDNITNMKRDVRYSELQLFLSDIHLRAVAKIQEVHADHGLAPELEQPPNKYMVSKSILASTNYFEAIRKLETNNDDIAKISNSIAYKLMIWERLMHKYNVRNGSPLISERNLQILLSDFTNIYVEQLEKLLWPKWYVACFTKSYHNSSMWANYADGHKGVCLVFESSDAATGSSMGLKRITNRSLEPESHGKEDWSDVSMEFREVAYTNKLEHIDFFRNIGRLPAPAVMKLWYTDEFANVSNCATHMASDNDQARWRNTYWDNFERYITTKSTDWAYERESRLTLHALLEGSLDPQQRSFAYKFESLKGIIFGLRTSDEDKLKIIDVVQKKCRENKRSYFKLFQSYYSPEHGDFRRQEIRLKIAEVG